MCPELISNNMPSKSKIKGSSWERDVSKFLTETYGQSFIRVSGSGAYVGGRNVARKSQLDEHQIQSHRGDINPPDNWRHFNAEAKNYDDLPLHQIFSGACRQLDIWLDQLVTVSEPGDLDILFIKLTRKCRLVVVREGQWHLDNHARYCNAHGAWMICDFDEFFQHNAALVKKLSTNISETNSIPNT